MEYKTYVCRKRARFKAICGQVNIPYGTTLTIQDGSIPNVHLSANCFEFGPLSTHIDFVLH